MNLVGAFVFSLWLNPEIQGAKAKDVEMLKEDDSILPSDPSPSQILPCCILPQVGFGQV